MKEGDLVKWRNGKDIHGCNLLELDESFFHYAVVIGIEDEDCDVIGQDDDRMITVLFEGHIFNVPYSVLSHADDYQHMATVYQKIERCKAQLKKSGDKDDGER